MHEEQAIPTNPSQRIRILDILRGFALLGILLVNIQLFALPNAAFANPLALGNLSNSDLLMYKFVHVFAELKFMSLFSILFGAGILLFVRRLEEKGVDGSAIHIRRMMWLLLFGMIHAYLIWFGDILVAYSIIGLIVVLLRKLKAPWKMILFLILYLIPMAFFYGLGHYMEQMPKDLIKESLNNFYPSMETIGQEISLYQNGSWMDIFVKRIQLNMNYQVGSFFMLTLWRTGGLMLLGMLLLDNGVLSAKKSNLFYAVLALVGLITGIVISNYGSNQLIKAKWDMIYYLKAGYLFNYFSSVFTTMGYLGVLILLYKLKLFQFLMKGFEAVGRLAFTNYLCQSVICSFIFYSYGFGLFGQFTRIELLYWVMGIWIFQITSSYFWLKYFRFGPLEYLWRYLSYRKWPVMSFSVNISK